MQGGDQITVVATEWRNDDYADVEITLMGTMWARHFFHGRSVAAMLKTKWVQYHHKKSVSVQKNICIGSKYYKANYAVCI